MARFAGPRPLHMGASATNPSRPVARSGRAVPPPHGAARSRLPLPDRTRPCGVFAHLSRRDTCPAQANMSAMLPLSADKPQPYPRIRPGPVCGDSEQPENPRPARSGRRLPGSAIMQRSFPAAPRHAPAFSFWRGPSVPVMNGASPGRGT